MLLRTLRLLGAGLLAGLLPLSAQDIAWRLATDDGNPATSDAPFSVTMDPDGVHAYVALCGELAPLGTPPANLGQFNNRVIQKIDARTGTVVAQGLVDFFPQEIALATDVNGDVERLYVTNSTSGTVSVLDANLAPLATVPLTPCFGAQVLGSFPFGIALSPDQRLAVVGTQGGCGFIEILDTDPFSPTYHQVLRTEMLQGTFGRPVWLDATRVLFPSVLCDPAFTWCQGHATVLDVSTPGAATTVPVSPRIDFAYDVANDAALTPQGRVLVVVGYGSTPRLVELDPHTLQITRQLDLSGAAGVQAYALAVDAVESYAYVGSFSSASEFTTVDLLSFQPVATLSTSIPGTPSALLNEIGLVVDRSAALVTAQGSEELLLLDQLAGHLLAAEAPAALGQGASAQVRLTGVEFQRTATVYASLVGPGPLPLGSQTIALTPPFFALGSSVGDASGEATVPFSVPAIPALAGLTVWMQAVTVDGSGAVRLSQGVDLLVL